MTLPDPPNTDPWARIARRRGRVEEALERSVEALAEVAPAELHRAVRNGVLNGGKGLRPLLTVAAYEELGGAVEGGLPDALFDLGAAVETIHAYSLVHDDLPCMDDAPLRRGRPTVHATHGVRRATIAGAVLIPWSAACAHRAALELGRTPAEARHIVDTLLTAAGARGMIGGQALDLAAEGRALSEPELEHLHGLKTGALLTVALEVGALAAAASSARRRAVVLFGQRLGLAFQVMDDLLDATGSAETLGKEPSDAALSKSTYVLLLGIEGARKRATALARDAVHALAQAGLAAPGLRALARFVVERER